MRATLRELLAGPEILVVPGGGSPLDILLAEQAGFGAAYLSGYAVAAQRYGLPDIGQTAYAEVAETVRAVCGVTRLPLIVDCDTGYGDVANMQRTIRGIEAAGAAAIQIEDQVWPKRCGHMSGKIVEPLDVARRKLAAALAARRSAETLIIARTDSLNTDGLDAALERCRAFKAEGADIVFVDGPESTEQLKVIAASLPGPVMVNMSESGLTPLHSAAELQAMGFHLVIFPSSAVRITLAVVRDFYVELRRSGDSRGWLDQMASLDECNSVVGLDRIRATEAAMLARA